MAAFCLPRDLSAKLQEALRTTLTPERLMGMSSAERRGEFAKIIGDENAREINAQFESKMLLKDQKRGLTNWANKLGNVTGAARKDIIDTINRLDRVLDPDEEKDFLGDLAAKKLGVSVTADEAKEVFQLAQKAEQLRDEITKAGEGDYRAGWTRESGTAYGNAVGALVDRINSLKPGGHSMLHNLENVLGLTRQMETGIFHWSAPFVQGYGMVSTKQFWMGIGKMFQYFADESNYHDLNGWILGHPDYENAKKGGLGMTKLGDKLSAREEDIQSSLLENANLWLAKRSGVAELIKGAPGPVRAMFAGDANLIAGWSRSFTGYLNYVRFARFTELLDAARLRGEDISPTSEATHDIAQVVNNFTGRAEIGYRDKAGAHAAAANMLLYTVRKNVATVQMFNPYEYAKPGMSQTARLAAIRQLSGMVLFTGAVATLAASMGAKVSMDPRDSDFLKIDIGGEKLDLGGANTSFVRFMARLITNQTVVHGQTKELGADPFGPSRGTVVANYIRGKLAPNASIIADALYGPIAGGGQHAFSIPQELYDRFTPIVIHSFMDYYLNNPGDAAAVIPSLSAFLGIGLDSPDPPVSESGRDVWGEPLFPAGGNPRAFGLPVGTPQAWRDDPVNREADRVGLRLNFPPDTIRGVKLTPEQYDDYVRLSGRMAHMRLEALIGSEAFQGAGPAKQKKLMQGAETSARSMAREAIPVQAPQPETETPSGAPFEEPPAAPPSTLQNVPQ